jgi:WD40 repeat protein
VNNLYGHTQPVTCIFLDEKYIYSGSEDKSIKVWNKHIGDLVRDLHFHADTIRSIVADEGHLYAASEDKMITIWNKQVCTKVMRFY